jgi:hypothetical protein
MISREREIQSSLPGLADNTKVVRIEYVAERRKPVERNDLLLGKQLRMSAVVADRNV